MNDFEIIIYRGDTPTLEFEFTDIETNTPINLSGWTLHFAAKRSDGTLIINKQMTIVDPLAGKATVALTSDETNHVGRHTAEVEARTNTDILTLAQGVLVIRGDIRP